MERIGEKLVKVRCFFHFMKVPGVGVPYVAEHMLMSYSVTLTMLYILAFQYLKIQTSI